MSTFDDPGFEGVGDFSSDDPWQRHIAHEAAKGNRLGRDRQDDGDSAYDTLREQARYADDPRAEPDLSEVKENAARENRYESGEKT